MNWRKSIIGALLTAISTSTLAFKVDTHVWVAQEVINNIETCRKQTGSSCINIEFDHEVRHLPIKPEVADAILKKSSYFRAGNLGPDAFPDIVVGQTIIHPGVTKKGNGKEEKSEYVAGFGTSDWLKLLKDRAEKITDPEEKKKVLAFVYGFMGHAAADVWAHTYVNTYAGDVFSLTDGETDVERRHIALEDYIAKHTPEIKDAKGTRLGDAFELIGSVEKVAIPEEFIRQNLMWDPDAHKQFANSLTGKHLELVVNLQTEIERSLVANGSHMSNTEYAKHIGRKFFEQYVGKGKESKDKNIEDVFAFVAENYRKDFSEAKGLEQFEVVALQILAYYYFDLELTTQEAAKTAELMNALQKFQSETIGKLAEHKEELQQLGAKLGESSFKLGLEVSDKIAAANAKIIGVTNAASEINRLVGVKNKRAGAMRALEKEYPHICRLASPKSCEKLEKVHKIANGETCHGGHRVCKLLSKVPGGKKACHIADEVCDTVFKEVIDRSAVDACFKGIASCKKSQDVAMKQINRARNDYRAVESELEQFLVNHANPDAELATAYQVLRSAAVTANDISQKLYQQQLLLERDLANDIKAMTQSHRGLIQDWSNDIKNAMREWTLANGKAMRNAIDQDKKTTVLGPLSRWKELYLPSILGVKQEFVNQTIGRKIAVTDQYDIWWSNLEKKAGRLDPKVLGKVIEMRDRFKEAAPFVIAKALNKPFADIVGTDSYQLEMTVHVAKGDISRGRLNEIFSTDTSGRHLLTFGKNAGSIADRVDVDMNMNANGKSFDPKAFAPARNAVTFASLALLDQDGISHLIGTDRYKLYFGDAPMQSLMLDSIRSIDGNHQWLQLAAPYPRAGTVDNDARWNEANSSPLNVSRRFSMFCQKAVAASGFALFRIEELKREVFDKIFVGVMNEALFLAKEHGFEDLLPANYPESFRSDHDHPFPAPSQDEGCL